jgi:hypothetical protein
LSWTIDYLVADAELLSGGKIEFPWLRENGYAFFDGKVFGHAPGRVFDEAGCWLWLRRGAVQLSNPQINTLTAHNGNKFMAILANQDTRPQSAAIALSQQALGIDPEQAVSVTVRGVKEAREVKLVDGVAQLDFGPRELLVVEVAGARIDIAAHRVAAEPAAGELPTEVEMKAGGFTVKAAAIAVEDGPWDAFVWCVAAPDKVRSATLETRVDGAWKKQTDELYPFEFRVPLASAVEPLRFRVRLRDAAGAESLSGEALLGAAGAVN